MRTRNVIGAALALIAGVCWGTVGLFTRYLNGLGFSSLQNALFRSFFGLIFLAVGMQILGISVQRPKHWKELRYYMVPGFGMAVGNAAFFALFRESTMSMAVVLSYTAPLFATLLAAVWYRERITLRKAASLMLAFLGCAVMAGFFGGAAGPVSPRIIGLGLLAGLGNALYLAGGRRASEQCGTYSATLFMFVFYFIGMIPLAAGQPMIPLFLNAPHSLLVIAGLGLVCTVVPYTLYTLSLRFIEVGTASVMIFIDPAIATILGWVIYGEPITKTVIVALVMIFLSLVAANLAVSPAKPETVPDMDR